MKHYFLLFVCVCLGAAQPSGGEEPQAPPPAPEAEAPAAEPVVDIKTVDGKVFRNATVERVTPSGIDIGYIRQDGTCAMIGLPLSTLTPDLQQKFGYDPEKARQFEAQLSAANSKPLEEVAESEAERMARVMKEVKERLSGADIRIQPADLRFAIYAHRRSVVVVPVERVLSGTVVTIIEDSSSQPKLLPPLVLIDQLVLPEGTGKWSGFLYPTGMHARYRDLDKIPVFADTLDNAQVLLNRYLDIYSDFAAAQKENPAAGTGTQNQAPDQAAPDSAASAASGVAGVDNKGSSVPNNGYYDNTGVVYSSDYPYFIGGSYWPVTWWSSNSWNHNRPWPGPPRPYPPRPYPPHPYPPHPYPPRPYPPRPPQPQPHPQPIGPVTPGFGYQTERNGGFRRAVPSPAPAMPMTWPGTPAPDNPPRMTPRPGGFGGRR